MKEMELKELVEINDEVVGDGLILLEDGVEKYMLIKAGNNPVTNQFDDGNTMGIKVVSNLSQEISEEEFEELKRQLIEALEDSFRPIKPENMN